MITMSSLNPTPPGNFIAPVVQSGPVIIIRWIGLKRRGWPTCGPLSLKGMASENTAPRFTSAAAWTIWSAVM